MNENEYDLLKNCTDRIQKTIMRRLVNRMPYPEIINIDLSTPCAVRFTWSGTRFEVREYYHVNEIYGGDRLGGNETTLLQALLQTR